MTTRINQKWVLAKRKGPGERYSYAVPDTGPVALPVPSVPLTAVSSLGTGPGLTEGPAPAQMAAPPPPPAAAADPEAQLPAPLEAPVPAPSPAVTESVIALAAG